MEIKLQVLGLLIVFLIVCAYIFIDYFLILKIHKHCMLHAISNSVCLITLGRVNTYWKPHKLTPNELETNITFQRYGVASACLCLVTIWVEHARGYLFDELSSHDSINISHHPVYNPWTPVLHPCRSILPPPIHLLPYITSCHSLTFIVKDNFDWRDKFIVNISCNFNKQQKYCLMSLKFFIFIFMKFFMYAKQILPTVNVKLIN